MRLISTFILVLGLIPGMACAPAKHTITQGAEGYIRLVRGNQMLSPGKPQTRGRGVLREIYFYAPARTADTQGQGPLFTHINSRLIAHTNSDSTGYYSVKLQPGRYSVFIKDNGKLFASESDGTGILCPVEIAVNKVTRKDILINYSAIY